MTFDVDANGILNVSAKELKTGKEQSIRIEASSGLSDEDIERMKREADEHAEADKAAKEKVDKVNSADSMIFSVEKQLEEIKDKVDEAKLAPVKEAVEELKKAHAAQDITQIDAATEKLNAALQSIQQDIQAAYAQNQQADNPGANADSGAESGSSDEEVTDVDFEEVK